MGPVMPWVVGMAAALASLATRRRPRLGFVMLMVLWLALGSLRGLVATHMRPGELVAVIPREPIEVVAHGIVVDDPAELFSPTEAERLVCVLQIDAVRLREGWRAAPGRVRVRIPGASSSLAYGDEVLVEGMLSRVPSPGNPGQYDWRAALARQQIYGLLSVRPFDPVVRLGAGHGWWGFRAVYALRSRWEDLLDRYFAAARAGLLRSLLLGERVALDETLKRAFMETGTVHLLVISGFNVGLIAWLLEWWLRFLGLPLRPRLAVSAICLGGYCVLTGLQAPVARATVMAWTVLGALWLDRVVNWPNALAAAGLALLWISPQQLFDPGFQLSFGAVASLLLLTSRLQPALEAVLPIGMAMIRRHVALSLATTCAVWIGLWPILAWYFHLISPVSVLANLVLVPLVSGVVGLGTITLTLGTLASPIVAWMSGALNILLDLTTGCVTGFHHLPYGCWFVGHPSIWLITGYYALLACSLWRRPLRLTVGWSLVAWLVGGNLWVWAEASHAALAARWLELTVLDVGHGDSIVIRTPDHRTLLVDTGTQEAGDYAVVPFLRFKGWTTLDALILTHPDDDHIGGAVPVLRGVRVKRLLTNGSIASKPEGQRLLRMASSLGLHEERLAAGMQLTGTPGVAMMVLHPPAGFVPGTRPFSNDNSLVIRLAKGATSVLLCGDLEENGVPWVMAWDRRLSSSVLKVPHHGSALGPQGRRFVEQVHPAVAGVSVGRLHHLPATIVLDDLAAVGARVLLTRDDGAITVRMDGHALVVTTVRGDGVR